MKVEENQWHHWESGKTPYSHRVEVSPDNLRQIHLN
jgi:hypothetical protein